MNPSQTTGNDDGAGGGNRASKKRRVTFGTDEAEAEHQEAPEAGVEKIGGDGAVSSALVTNEQVDQYLPRILKSTLDDLIRRQLVQGIPLTLEDLVVAAPKYVPYQRSRKMIPTCREGWNGLDENLMRNILFRLNLREKVICTSMVCKAWSELKGKTPGLFVDLGCPSGPSSAEQMCNFLRWIPLEDVQACTSLRIETKSTDTSWQAGSLLDDFSELRNPRLAEPEPDSDDEEGKRERSDLWSKSLSDIQKVCLVGPKIKEGVNFTARCYGLGYSLTHFIIDEISYTGALAMTGGEGSYKHDSFKFTLQNFSEALQVFEIPASLVSCHGLSDTLSSIGPPALLRSNLRVLDLTKKTTGVPAGKEADNIHWTDLAKIGQYCPMLEVLKLPMVTGSDSDGGTSMITLPSLRSFLLGRIVSTNSNEAYGITALRGSIMWLLGAMPIVEDFSFGHGECANIDRELLPGIGHDGVFNFPTSLRKLHLRDLNIESSALASSNINIDTIESITLENCGNNQVHALKNFCRRYQGRSNGARSTVVPSLGVSGDSAFMVRGSASFSADVVEIDE